MTQNTLIFGLVCSLVYIDGPVRQKRYDVLREKLFSEMLEPRDVFVYVKYCTLKKPG